MSKTISSFELLVQKIAPGNSPSFRRVVQAYFLSVSNLSKGTVELALDFTAKSPDFDKVVTIFDGVGINDFGNLQVNPNDPSKQRATINLQAGDTGLFILQPNIIENPTLDNLEIRGFAEVSVGTFSPTKSPVQLLLAAQSRGTFLPSNFDSQNPSGTPISELDFDQIAYDLPLAEGKAMIEI